MFSYFAARLEKHRQIFSIVTALFAGLSLAYFTGTLFSLYFNANRQRLNIAPLATFKSMPQEKFISIDDVRAIVTGSLFRGHGGAGTNIQNSVAAPAREIELVGVVAGSFEFARAAIRLEGDPAVKVYKIGSVVEGYRITAVRSYSIVLNAHGSSRHLFVGEKLGGMQAGANMGDSVAAQSGETITIRRDRLISLSQNQEELYKNKFAPITRDGKIQGFKLIFVPPDNLLYEFGARSGDIIRRVNGEPLENSEKMFQLWMDLKNANQVTVDLERGGKLISYNIQIQN